MANSGSKRGGKVALGVVTAVTVALLCSLLASSRAPAAPGPEASPASAVQVAPGSKSVITAAGQGAAPAPSAPLTLEQVRRAVEENNRAASADRRAAAAEGWTLVDAAPPDEKLTRLDPSLLPSREAELRTQIASTTATPGDVDNLAEIARRAAEEQTRTLAVEALGRAGPDGQPKLLALLDQLPEDDRARREIIPLLRPSSVDAPLAADLAARLDSGHLGANGRQQAAFTLALLSLRDGRPLPEAVRDHLSSDSRSLLEAMDRLARNATLEANDTAAPGVTP